MNQHHLMRIAQGKQCSTKGCGLTTHKSRTAAQMYPVPDTQSDLDREEPWHHRQGSISAAA
jgi:hypothetical protein